MMLVRRIGKCENCSASGFSFGIFFANRFSTQRLMRRVSRVISRFHFDQIACCLW